MVIISKNIRVNKNVQLTNNNEVVTWYKYYINFYIMNNLSENIKNLKFMKKAEENPKPIQ